MGTTKRRWFMLLVEMGRPEAPWRKEWQRVVARDETDAGLSFRARAYSADGTPLERLVQVAPYRSDAKSHWLATVRE